MFGASQRYCHYLLGHTRPRSDELLSSWLVRLALQNGLKVHSLCQRVWRDGPVWNRDIDNSAPSGFIEALSNATALESSHVRGTTLAALEGHLFEKHNPSGNTPWILPIGVYHRTRRRFGLQFCPHCLDEAVPYFRRSWRLAYTVVCPTHRVVLSDRCACGSAVNFHRSDIGGSMLHRLDVRICPQCGCDLRRCRASPVDLAVLSQALFSQTRCSNALESGYALVGASYVRSILFFVGVHQMLRLLTGQKNAQALFETCASWTRPLSAATETKGGRLERADTFSRMVLMSCIAEWLDDWPAQFIRSCQRAGVTSSDVYKDLRSVPFWLATVVDEYLDRSAYSPTLPEIRSAIEYVRRSEGCVNKSTVSRVLGARDAFRKRRLLYLLEERDEAD